MEDGGRKDDQEKPKMGLLSSVWLVGVAKVLTFGAKKYNSHNWRKGIHASRLYDAAQRHLTSWNDGEDLDPETRLSHLLHASCCLMFLYETMLDKPHLDDRHKRLMAQGLEPAQESMRKFIEAERKRIEESK